MGTDVSDESGDDKRIEDKSSNNDCAFDHDMSNSIKYNLLNWVSRYP